MSASYAFAVTLVGPGTAAADAAFQEVSGIDPHVQIEDVAEGGVNAWGHQLPGVTKHANLVLKRGDVRQDSALAVWAQQAMGSTLGTPIQTQTLRVTLMSADGAAMVVWTFSDAWPIKWLVASLDGAEALTETLEIVYSSVTRALAPV